MNRILPRSSFISALSKQKDRNSLKMAIPFSNYITATLIVVPRTIIISTMPKRSLTDAGRAVLQMCECNSWELLLARIVSSSVYSLTNADIPLGEGEVENTYRLLTDDDVSSGTWVQTRNTLQRDGIPVKQVEFNFVPHQIVYNHLTKCLETKLDELRECMMKRFGRLRYFKA